MILPGLRRSFLRLCLLILFLGLAGEAGAQPAPPPPAGSQIPAVDPAALDHLIQTLQDPKTRDQFLADLKTLRTAQQKIVPQPAVVA